MSLQIAASVPSNVPKVYFSSVATSETTTSTTPTNLSTAGPSIDLVIPSNALVAFFVQATMNSDNAANTARVYLNDSVEGSTILLTTTSTSAVVMDSRFSSSSGTTHGWSNLGNTGTPFFPASTGAHTYKLLYCVTAGTGTFSARKLWVVVYPS